MNDDITRKNVLSPECLNDESLDTLLGEVAGEFFDRMTNGERPQIEDYVTRYPEIAEQIRAAFPALQIVGDSRAENNGKRTDIDLAGQKTLGDFRIVGELGRGGMGVVYEAEQLSMGRKVALKVLPFAALAQEKSLQRFRNEVRAAGSLNHPNIVPIYAVGEERGVHFFAMQLIRGQSMADVIVQLARLQSGGESLHAESISQALSVVKKPSDHDSRDEPTVDLQTHSVDTPNSTPPHMQETLRETQARISTEGQTQRSSAFFNSAVGLGLQAAEALQHAHDLGVLHRDIKPGNLMLDAEGQLFITDFGLARIATDVGVTMTGDVVGTLRYMSPEQLLGKRVVIDQRCDIYSLGVTLYELLTLRLPYDGGSRQELITQIAFETPPKPRQICRSIPLELETIILKAIEKDPDERYATATDLAYDLHAFLEDRPIKAKPPTFVQRTAKWSRRHKPLVWSAGLSVAALLLLGLVFLAASNALIAIERNEKSAALAALTLVSVEKDNALFAADANVALADKRRKQSQLDFDRALNALDTVVEQLSSAEYAQIPGVAKTRSAILQRMLAVYEEIAEQHGDDPYVLQQNALAHGRVSEILVMIDQHEEAQKRVNQGIEILTALQVAHPNDLGHHHALAHLLFKRLHHSTRSRSERLADAKTALQLQQHLVDAGDMEDDGYKGKVGTLGLLHLKVADLLPQDSPDVSTHIAKSIRIPESQGVTPHWGSYITQGRRAAKDRDWVEAEKHYLRGIELARHSLETGHRVDRGLLGRNLSEFADLLGERGRKDEAKKFHLEAIDVTRTLCQEYGRIPAYETMLSNRIRPYVMFLNDIGEPGEASDLVADFVPQTAHEFALRGNCFAALSQFELAIADHERAVGLQPDNPRRHHALALILRHVAHPRFRDYDRAVEHCQRALELKPDDVPTLVLLAGILEEKFHDTKQALKYVNKAIEYEPSNERAFQKRARIHESNGDFAQALADINNAIELRPETNSYVNRANIRLSLNQVDLALADLKLAEESNHINTYVYQKRADIYVSQERYNEALDELNKSLRITPFRSWVYKRRGLVHFHLERYADALADIAKAVELNPTDGSNFFWIDPELVVDCPDQTLFDEVLRLANATIQSDDCGSVRYGRAKLLAANGDYNLALIDVNKAIELDPENDEVRTWRIKFYAENAYWDELNHALAEWSERHPNDIQCIHQSAVASIAVDDQASYRGTCQQMLMTFADSDTPLESHLTAWTCALVANSLDNYDPAIDLARHAVDEEKDNSLFRVSLGAILMRASKYSEAKVHLDAALENEKTDGTLLTHSRYFLAMTEHYLGHQQSAKDLLEAANKTAEQELSGSPAWNRRLALGRLRNEAETLIVDAADSPRANGKNSEFPSTLSSIPETTGSHANFKLDHSSFSQIRDWDNFGVAEVQEIESTNASIRYGRAILKLAEQLFRMGVSRG